MGAEEENQKQINPPYSNKHRLAIAIMMLPMVLTGVLALWSKFYAFLPILLFLLCAFHDKKPVILLIISFGMIPAA